MNKFLKMITLNKRSIITSFLFILITILFILHLILNTFCNDDKNNYLINNSKFNKEIYNKLDINQNIIYNKYLKEYTYYLFYNRSYPSINKSDVNDYELLKLKEFINIKFSNVLIIRKIYKYLHISSFIFIVNILIIVLIFIYFKINSNLNLLLYKIISMIFIVNFLFLLICGFGYKYVNINKNIYYIILNSMFDYSKVFNILKTNLLYLITCGILLFVNKFVKYYR